MSMIHNRQVLERKELQQIPESSERTELLTDAEKISLEVLKQEVKDEAKLAPYRRWLPNGIEVCQGLASLKGIILT